MKLVETRIIDTGKVRNMCIENDYYTRGTNEQYCNMFSKCALSFSVMEIAVDIFQHSNMIRLEEIHGSIKEALENICYQIINDCSYTLVDVEMDYDD